MSELDSLPKHGFVDRVVPRHEFRSEIARLIDDCVLIRPMCCAEPDRGIANSR